jgi:hypothetical protein
MPKFSWQSAVYRYCPEIAIAIIFVAVYAFSLSFVYVEGDDATSVLYHALGRNFDLQPPYSPYHGMMDVLLALLPANETVLRHVAILFSAFSATLVMIFILRLIRILLPEIGSLRLVFVVTIILLSIPEIFYLGLIYSPSLVALALVLAAHILARISFSRFSNSAIIQKRHASILLLSLLLFGIGVACRWDIGSYILVIAADIIFNIGNTIQSKRSILLAVFWTAGAIIVSIVAINVSGYGLNELYQILKLARREVFNPPSWFAIIGAYQTLVTPAFLIFFVTGCCVFTFRKKKLLILVLLGILPVFPYFYSREPKMILPALPGMCLALAAGINLLWFSWVRSRYLLIVRTLLTVLILAPWLIGFQVLSTDTSWGPGFQVRSELSNSPTVDDSKRIVADSVSDRRVSIANIKMMFEGGFAIPTPEGPRPVGGHAFVLFGGEWRDLVDKLDDERDLVASFALSSKLNILQDEGNSLMIVKLVQKGFNTNDKKGNYRLNNISERRFTDSTNQFIEVQILPTHNSLFEKDRIQELMELNSNHKIVLYSGYTSTFRKLMIANPKSIQMLGPFSGVLDLDEHYESLNRE